MQISPEAKKLIEEEEEILASVLASLREQRTDLTPKMLRKEDDARDITRRYLAAKRDSDRQLLSSDVTVSRKLAERSTVDAKELDILLEKPYFARIILDELTENGRTRQIEYKIGSRANVDCRIVNWKNAPISKLYYEYAQGDEYSELIQGKEREGVVRVRHKLQIEDGELKRIACVLGNFVRVDGAWQQLTGAFHKNSSQKKGQLPDVLSLISAEQFRAITEEASSTVLIQGTAGSGKTTVALYRLAWLLHQTERPLRSDQVLIIVKSKVLCRYIQSSLDALNLSSVKVLVYHDWARKLLGRVLNTSSPQLSAKPHRSVYRVKRSLALFHAIEHNIERTTLSEPREILFETLENYPAVLDRDQTKLLDRELILDAYKWTKNNFQKHQYDRSDEALLVYIHQLQNSVPSAYQHIVVDETQDFAPIELATLVRSVSKVNQLTLVGDAAQQISTSSSFAGWEQLQKHWGLESDLSRFISLNVSHRSTLPIMRLADHVLGEKRTTQGRAGKPPLWFACKDEDRGVSEALSWLERVSEKYPDELICVICHSREQARYVTSLLEPSFPSAVRLGDEDSFSFEEGILVTDVRNVKGLEFAHVLLWNPSREAYPNNRSGKNRLYVAITRAEEHVCLVSWDRPSKHLPNIHSALIRGFERNLD